MTTTFVVTVFVAVTTASFFLGGWLLWLGARWARIPDVTFRRALWATAWFTLVALACRVFISASGVERSEPLLALIILLVGLFVGWKIIAKVFRASYGRAMLAWLPTLAGTAVALLFIAFAFKPFVLEAYMMPSNGMAPTILGDHFETRCPRCGGTMIISAALPVRHEELGICSRCLQTATVKVPSSAPISGDHFLVLKFLAPGAGT